jgi:GNAT superfamily N-acetyltransferase
MDFALRKARVEDMAAIADVIPASVRGLAIGYYDDEEIELSIRSVFGVDRELIDDGTYFVAVDDDRGIVGCGGWSRRKTLYGASDYSSSRNSAFLDPMLDAAKIRAFFIHPDAARRGIGRAILEACEAEAKSAGFSRAEMMATLPGVPLYSACGYQKGQSVDIPVGDDRNIECIVMSKELA